jgi:hypothetical protein
MNSAAVEKLNSESYSKPTLETDASGGLSQPPNPMTNKLRATTPGAAIHQTFILLGVSIHPVLTPCIDTVY